MPKNTKRGKNSKNQQLVVQKRELIVKTEEQMYAKVLRMLGEHRIECELVNGQTKLGIIRARMRRGGRNSGNYVSIDDIILVATRDFQDDKVDVIHLYKSNEVEELIKMGEDIPRRQTTDDHFILFDIDEDTDALIIDDI